jgi:hypothetical protein
MCRRAVVLALGLVACGDDAPNDDAVSSTTETSTGTSMDVVDDGADPMQPCQSADSRLTVFLEDEAAEAFVVEISQGTIETVTCPDATIDGNFAVVVCEVGQVTLQRPEHFWPLFWVRVDGGPQEAVEPSCENTSMCPKQERNVCEVHLDGGGDPAGSSTSG